MAKNPGIVQGGARRRPPAERPPAAPVVEVKKRVGLAQFLREVRVEARKVTWTSWKETWITSVMVGIMVLLTAFFFFGVDWILHLGMGAVLKYANGE